jgi:hypothetical protein
VSDLSVSTNRDITAPQTNSQNLDGEAPPPSEQLTNAANENDFGAARQVLDRYPEQKDALLTKLLQTDLGAYHRVVNPDSGYTSQTDIDSRVTPSVDVPSPTLIAGKPVPDTVNIDMGEPRRTGAIEWISERLGHRVQVADPANFIARGRAKLDYGLTVNADGRTLTLPNTRRGGEVLASIQTKASGYYGNNIDHAGILPFPKDASKEFKEGYNNVMRAHGRDTLVQVIGIIAGGTIGARASRPSVNMNSGSNVPAQVRAAGSAPNRTDPAATPGTTGRSQGSGPASNGSGTNNPQSAATGQKLRENLARQAGIPRGVDNVWGSNLADLKKSYQMDGYSVTVKPPRASTSGNAQVFTVDRHPFIKEVQYSPSTAHKPVADRSQHVGQYYKFTYQDGSKVKIIDPQTYKLSAPEKNTTYYNQSGQQIKFDPTTRAWGRH